MATISLCLIIKNEETVLARCLESVQGLFDETIIVDTGSIDSTQKIAARYTSKLYSFPWNSDFAAARNFSFSKATQEYIFWMDADDVFKVSHMADFLSWKEKNFQNADMIYLPYYTAWDDAGKPLVSFDRERIVRNHAGFSWEGRVHETLTHPHPEKITKLRLDIPIFHYSVKTTYSDRNLLIYKKQLAEGETLSLRDTFYYARELLYHENWDQAIHYFTTFLQDPAGWRESKPADFSRNVISTLPHGKQPLLFFFIPFPSTSPGLRSAAASENCFCKTHNTSKLSSGTVQPWHVLKMRLPVHSFSMIATITYPACSYVFAMTGWEIPKKQNSTIKRPACIALIHLLTFKMKSIFNL